MPCLISHAAEETVMKQDEALLSDLNKNELNFQTGPPTNYTDSQNRVQDCKTLEGGVYFELKLSNTQAMKR